MQMYSVVQAAHILGLSPYTIRFLIRQGKLFPVRVGRRVLLRDSELARFVDESESQSKKPQ